MNVASAYAKIFLAQFSRNANVLLSENMGGDFITIYASIITLQQHKSYANRTFRILLFLILFLNMFIN